MSSIQLKHPGKFIKAEVIPKGMTVKEAAELIGVGRPALSNLLNGNASLTANMAARIEKAFGYSRVSLLKEQATYDMLIANQKSTPTNVKKYVPQFLTFTANQIEAWASHNILARSRLSVLLRTLVHSTGIGLIEVDFPGNDDSQRSGWDGHVLANEGTPWVPAGKSGWEFGTNQTPKSKAEKDYAKSVKATDPKDSAEMEFVFVTPVRWAGKNDWVDEKIKENIWKSVRVYDSSNLEQWMEQSIPGQAWFANETGAPTQNVRTLDRCWKDWAEVASPTLPGSLFSLAIDESKQKLISLLSKDPERPIVVTADSTEEALAFLAQCFSAQGGVELECWGYKCLVFDKAGVLPTLVQGQGSFIPIVHTREVELELGPYAKQMHSIVVSPRNAFNVKPDIILEPVSHEIFNSALQGIGKIRDEIKVLANESGRSLTVLRRRLATVDAVRTPQWSIQPLSYENLIAFMFVGTWHEHNEVDKVGLTLLATEQNYEKLEKDCQLLVKLNDSPMWSIGAYRGVVSKIDLLYAIAGHITRDDLKRYFDLARMVLGEDDPSLDLDENQRWAAPIYGKTREFSSAFRQGICETLVLLAVHGVSLFKLRLGIDTEEEATQVVRDLLCDPLNTRKLQSNDCDLPLYAEAAPSEFLSIIERDIKSNNSAVFDLLRQTKSGIFSSPSRTGLLWALEGLAWNLETLTRTVMILARLAQIEINDNWANTPVRSLVAIFRSWMPQTIANNVERFELVKELFKRFPDVAWSICTANFGCNNQIGEYSHKPTWRRDGVGFGEPISKSELMFEFMGKMISLALSRPNYSRKMLSDLIDRLPSLSNADQDKVWGLVFEWAKNAEGCDKVILREKIRVSILSFNARKRQKRNGNNQYFTVAAKQAYDALESSNLFEKHAWLFKSWLIDLSADQVDCIGDIDFKEQEKRNLDLRVNALKEIQSQHGIDGLLFMAISSNIPNVIGDILAQYILEDEKLLHLVNLSFQKFNESEQTTRTVELLIQGILRGTTVEQKGENFLRCAITVIDEKYLLVILTLAPFGEAIWSLVTSCGEKVEKQYWMKVKPRGIWDSPSEITMAVERLRGVKRPRAGFALVCDQPEQISVCLLFQLLSEMVEEGHEKEDDFQFRIDNIEKAFDCISNTSELSIEQKAGLEFKYLDILDSSINKFSKSCIPNLEQYIENHPEILVQVIVWTYKRTDLAIDPPNYFLDPTQANAMALRGYTLINALKRIPGSDANGIVDVEILAKWIGTVRELSYELARIESADNVIGKILASSQIGKDGVWPCEAVRTVMEDVQSESIMAAVQTGVYNLRGLHAVGHGGEQEYELAEKYRNWAKQIQISSPFVASELLMKLSKTYESEAVLNDSKEKIKRRIR